MTAREMVSWAIPDGAFLRRDRENALFITQCFIKRLSQTNTDILHRVMVVHLRIAVTFYL